MWVVITCVILKPYHLQNFLAFLFNVIIYGLSLRELYMSGTIYTCANNLNVPTYEKLDRILMSTEWEHKFPLSTVNVLTRDISASKLTSVSKERSILFVLKVSPWNNPRLNPYISDTMWFPTNKQTMHASSTRCG
jgi:hypothetical protein